MSIRRALWLVASFALGALLINLLIRIGRLDLASTIRALKHVSLANTFKLLALNAVLVMLSTIKWRTTDSALRHSSDPAPSRMTAYAVSASGMALGLILPVQFGMTAARTVGTIAYGRTLKRGTGGTVFEQAFDLLVTILLSGASLITYAARGGAWTWSLFAITGVSISLLIVKQLSELVERLLSLESERRVRNLLRRVFWNQSKFLERSLTSVFAGRDSALLNPRLIRWLMVLSAFRFGVVVLMAEQIAIMTGAEIRLWAMAAAIPFAAISNFIALTPGGVGVNEFASVTALRVFGTPLGVASQWALANRVLMMGSYFVLAALGVAVAGVFRLSGRVTDDQCSGEIGEI